MVAQLAVPDVERSTDPALVREATEYGGWVLPPNSKVLLVEKMIIRDRDYRIAVEMSPGDLVAMLEQSKFAPALQQTYPPFQLHSTIAGPSLDTSPTVRHAQAWFASAAGKVMMRDVTVDERDANIRIVHIEFRGV
ncbi:hypothetical protein [Nocardia asteroides]|uniref:hypothetical protein n=1 Tax=Nocardia asteroides TaxID=1824 RepID=UPI00366172DA